MHLDILTFIILPNVGYWRGEKIVNKGKLNYTKKVLSVIRRKKLYIKHELDGLIHSENDLPAIKWHNGSKEWFKRGKLHRENNLPAIILNSGTKLWFKNGKYECDLSVDETSQEKL